VRRKLATIILAGFALGVLSFLTRLPALMNASGTNSDAAVVGLQARHIFHEWSPFMAGVSHCGDTRNMYDNTGWYRWEIGPPEMRFLRSRARASLVRGYLLARFFLDAQTVGAMPLGADSQGSPGLMPWDGVAIAVILPKGTIPRKESS